MNLIHDLNYINIEIIPFKTLTSKVFDDIFLINIPYIKLIKLNKVEIRVKLVKLTGGSTLI
jgi:hypothetical protein